MRRRTLLGFLAHSTVLLGGCTSSGSDETQAPTETPTPTGTPTPTPAFDASTTFPVGGVVGEPVPVQVTVTNGGDGDGEYEATLTHDGSSLTNTTVPVDSGASATTTLEHAFGDAGDYDVAAGGNEATLTVYDDELDFVDAAMTAVDTLRIEQTIDESGQIDLGNGPVNWEKNSAVTIEKNYAADSLYKKSEDDLVVGSSQLDETVEVWIVDGVRYERKTKHTEGVVEYSRSFTEKPTVTTALDVHGSDIESFLGLPHTGSEYVFDFDPQSSEGATALMARVIGSGGILPAEKATAARLELRYDRGTGRATRIEYELTIDGATMFPYLDQTITDDYVAYGEPVDVEVPDVVKDNAT